MFESNKKKIKNEKSFSKKIAKDVKVVTSKKSRDACNKELNDFNGETGKWWVLGKQRCGAGLLFIANKRAAVSSM